MMSIVLVSTILVADQSRFARPVEPPPSRTSCFLAPPGAGGRSRSPLLASSVCTPRDVAGRRVHVLDAKPGKVARHASWAHFATGRQLFGNHGFASFPRHLLLWARSTLRLDFAAQPLASVVVLLELAMEVALVAVLVAALVRLLRPSKDAAATNAETRKQIIYLAAIVSVRAWPDRVTAAGCALLAVAQLVSLAVRFLGARSKPKAAAEKPKAKVAKQRQVKASDKRTRRTVEKVSDAAMRDVLGQLESPSESTRAEACTWLGMRGEAARDALPRLVNAVENDESWHVRVYACLALGSMATAAGFKERAVPALQACRKDPDVITAADWALAQRGIYPLKRRLGWLLGAGCVCLLGGWGWFKLGTYVFRLR